MADLTYLDYAASTPPDPRVLAAMAAVAALTGNPSSVHAAGRELRAAVDRARSQVARLLGVEPSEITFTSGATEANGLAIRGVLRAIQLADRSGEVAAQASRGLPRILLSGLEHASVLESAAMAVEDGEAAIDIVPSGKGGVMDAGAVAQSITRDTAVVAVQWANNVLGTLQPIATIGGVVRTERARRSAAGEKMPLVFVCDAVQAMRSEDVRPEEAGVDILSLSAHKLYGPKGTGAAWVRRGTPLAAIYGGGGQESGRRHGTENAASIVGLGAAAEILLQERADDAVNVSKLRGTFIEALARQAPQIQITGSGIDQVPGIVFLRHPRITGDELALKLDAAGFAVSAGSACDAGKRKAPRALAAVLDEQAALRGGIRVSFGRFTAAHELASCAAALARLG